MRGTGRNLTGLAEPARAVGDGETQRTCLQALVLLRERMAAARPGDITAQLDLAGAHRGLGDCYAGFGQDVAAYETSRAEVAVLVLLAATDPSGVYRQDALASAYGVLADRARGGRIAGPGPGRRPGRGAHPQLAGRVASRLPGGARPGRARRRLASLPCADPPPGGLSAAVGAYDGRARWG